MKQYLFICLAVSTALFNSEKVLSQKQYLWRKQYKNQYFPAIAELVLNEMMLVLLNVDFLLKNIQQ